MQLRRFPSQEQFCDLARGHNVIPVGLEILADTETPVSLLGKLYAQNKALFLLESVEGGERWGRYSFLGTSASWDIQVFPETVEITRNGTTESISHQQDPLAVLRAFMNRFRPIHPEHLPRFWGGMVGYFTYESVCFFEKIRHTLAANKPLAHFVVPDELLIFDNVKHTLTLVAIAFVDDPRQAPEAYDQAWERIHNLQQLLQEPIPAERPSPTEDPIVLTSPVAENDFRQQVLKTKQYIHDGDIIQAVISQPFQSQTVPDLWMLYRAQRYVNPSPYMFFLNLGKTALVGSSPETMVRLENRIATVRPIAGTRPRGDSEQSDRQLADELLKDEKERAEHLMLVDLGRNDLGRVAETGTVQVTDLMVVERYSHVMHLVSNVCCDLRNGADAWDLFKATFPAGTLSGAPKIRAMEIISDLEKTPRGPYGGALGYISFHGNMDMAITIRTACVEGNRLTVQAGAGIVADSDPEKERIETVNKAMALQKALELIQTS